MPDSTPTATVSFTVEDALKIVQTLGALAAAVNPASATAIAVVTGAAQLIDNTLVPAIKQFHNTQLSVAEQASLAAQSALERARVGAPAATIQ